jgi:diguanylate cyclase (GGDEF)-like protein/PAS domain S-box-containing protein
MNATTSLLRVAARASAATAALVARPGDDAPVAAWGCDEATGRLLLRLLRGEAEGASLFRRVPLVLADGSSAELLLVAPRPGGLEGEQLGALASQIGAVCDGSADAERDALDQLTETIDQFSDAVAILRAPASLDDAAQVVHINAAFTRLFGFAYRELAGGSPDRLYGPLTDQDRVYFLRSRLLAREEARAVLVLYTHERTPMWTELSLAPIAEGERRGDFYFATFRDVTSRKQFEDALASEKRKLQTTLAAIADAVVTVLGDGRVEFVNAAAQRLLGIDLVDAYGAHVGAVIPLVDREGVEIDLLGGSGDEPLRGEGHMRGKNGPMDIAYVASRIAGDEHAVVVVLRDITAEHRLALRLSFEANHDPLTGLPNRRAFVERLEEAIRTAREQETQHAVAFLDLDRFKILNDRFGHALGDRFLREIARVMGRVVRGADVIGRIGGDEFALLLNDCSLENARTIADKMRQAVENYKIGYRGESLGVGVSIGLAAIDASTSSAEQALAEADAACYQAKAAGRNVVAG